MSRLPSVTGRQVIAALGRLGFQRIRIRGSHHYLRHPDGRKIGPGLLSKILRDAEITKAELAANL